MKSCMCEVIELIFFKSTQSDEFWLIFRPKLIRICFGHIHIRVLFVYADQFLDIDVILFIVCHYRVLGFTGIVKTDCNQTTKLLTHANLEWPIYVNPISLFIIFWMSTSELRLYVFHKKSKVCELVF